MTFKPSFGTDNLACCLPTNLKHIASSCIGQSANFYRNHNELLTKSNKGRAKQSTELGSKSNGRESGIFTETMTGKIPAILLMRTQNRHYIIVERRRNNTKRLDPKKNKPYKKILSGESGQKQSTK